MTRPELPHERFCREVDESHRRAERELAKKIYEIERAKKKQCGIKRVGGDQVAINESNETAPTPGT